jgi:hypothetical protein
MQTNKNKHQPEQQPTSTTQDESNIISSSITQDDVFSSTTFKSNEVGLKLRKQLEKDTFERASQNCYDSCGGAMAKGLEFLGAYKNIKKN